MAKLLDVGFSRNEATYICKDDIEEDDYVEGFSYKPGDCLFYNYKRLSSWPFIKQSFETDMYYLVFKPFNKNYDYHFNGMDYVRKWVNNNGGMLHGYMITREILEEKVHYNLIVFTPKDMLKYHDKHTSRYWIHCQHVPMKDKYIVHDYIVKESKKRFMGIDKDIKFYTAFRD